VKKIFFVFITALFLLSAMLVSCAPVALTADQVIQKLAANGKNLKTGNIQMDMNMTVNGQTVGLTSTGIFENPEKSYLTVNLLGQSIQILSISRTEIYQRDTEKDPWVKSDASASDQAGNMYDFTKNPEQLLKFYKNAKLLPEESVEGCPTCYHVSFELDVAEMMKAGGVSESVLRQVEFNRPANVESWISKTDFFTRKQTSKFTLITAGQEVSMDILIALTEINKPVVIPTP
jgi:hypothetical protein